MYARYGEVKTQFRIHRIKKFFSTKSIANCIYRREGKQEEKTKEKNNKTKTKMPNIHQRAQ